MAVGEEVERVEWLSAIHTVGVVSQADARGDEGKRLCTGPCVFRDTFGGANEGLQRFVVIPRRL